MYQKFVQTLAVFSLLFAISQSALADSKTPQSTIGGRFILKSHTGQIVTDQDFVGKFMLIYFGYTYCPDICPTSLQTVSHALDLLGDKAKDFQPLFVTIDPERDTIPVLRDYVKVFHPSLIGLTGSKESLASITKKYHVKYEKVSESGAINDDYSIDHTAAVFVMGPQGEYITRFGYNTTSKQMAAKLAEILKKAEDRAKAQIKGKAN